MRTLFMGSPEFAVPFLQLLHQKTNLVGVWTKPAKPAGRGLEVTASPIANMAKSMGVPVVEPVSLQKEKEFLKNQLEQLSLDLIVVVAYGKILPADFLSLARYGCINVHASLLPKYRGAAPIQWALIHGEKETGITLMQMDAGMDTGDILAQQQVLITPSDNIDTLKKKLSDLGIAMLSQFIDDLSIGKTPHPIPQNSSLASSAPPLKKEDGYIFFDKEASLVLSHIQGVTPWPGAHVSFISDSGSIREPLVLKLFAPSLSKLDATGKTPGEILAINTDGIHVACKMGTLCIAELQLPGKKRLAAHLFQHQQGYSLHKGVILGRVIHEAAG